MSETPKAARPDLSPGRQPLGPLVVFPGQGSQRPGMAEHLIREFPGVAGPVMARADTALDMPLTELCVNGTAEELARTEVTQPAIVATSLAVWEILRSGAGLTPSVLAGHSLGEYTALAAAGVLSYESALSLVRYRGILMAAAAEATPGTMAAVMGLPAGRVEELCWLGGALGVVEVANYNDPGQTVVSGEVAAVDEVVRLAREAGAEKTVPLQVSAPFHCSLMKAVEEDFAAELLRHEFSAPRIPVISSVTGNHVHGAEEARALLRRQLAAPVRWTRILEAGSGFISHVEAGPGRVLSGFANRFGLDRPVRSTHDARRIAALLKPADATLIAS